MSPYYYEAVRLTVPTNAVYAFSTKRAETRVTAYIYKHQFDRIQLRRNQISVKYYGCNFPNYDGFTAMLQANITYILVVADVRPMVTTPFSITVYGSTNVTLEAFSDNSTYCYIGGPCETHLKSIGLTLDDILYYKINRNMTINGQSLAIKISGALTIIMFVVGAISSACSILTFQNEKLRQVGCGLYLLASSITSLATITLFTIKFWFVIITQMDTSIRLSILESGCKSIDTLLKFFFCWDAWLNACVAVERAVSVHRGINFNKDKSKRYARLVIFILPCCVMATLIHEPLYRLVFSYETMERQTVIDVERIPADSVTGKYAVCRTSYSSSVQDYDTVILFIHLVGPFIINLLSALFIIIRNARRRLAAQKKQTYKQHICEQWKEHKQLIISPIVLLLLSTPRLIVSLLSACLKVADYAW
ncbi:unnamed protein product, partial [Adineta ricciae]